MEREQTTIRLPAESARNKADIKEFIKYIKGLDERQQAGLCLTIEGLKILAYK